LFSHVVETAGEFAELVAAFGLRAGGELAAGERAFRIE
jgi:hypothetical protein